MTRRALAACYLVSTMAVGFAVAVEADLNGWQTAACVLLAPAMIPAAVVHEALDALEGVGGPRR